MFNGEGGDFPRPKALESVQMSAADIDISLYNTTELYALRARIDARLPPTDINELDLEEEVVRQFMQVRDLQAQVLNGNEEANKKAAVINACTNALQALAKLQVELHTAERFKKIENLLIKHLKLLPVEVAESFMDQYQNLILEPQV